MPVNDLELPKHRLPRALFDQMCAGAGDTESAAAIQAGLYSRRRLLLCALLDLVADLPDVFGPLNDPDEAWHVLAAVDDGNSDVVAEILTHPTVGVWVSRALRKVRGGTLDLIPLWTELGYLHCIAAAAAIRTGTLCELRLPAIHGMVTLPTVGQIRLPVSFPIGFVELAAGSREVTVRARNVVMVKFSADQRSAGFTPVRRHRSTAGGITLDVEIDDCDPYREFSAPIAPDRLDEIQVSHWCKQVSEAWQILTSWHRPHAMELSASIRTLVPIPAGVLTGASSSAAFGAIALGPVDTATSLAETLLHEIQHSKLNALFDLLQLHHDDGVARWYAPWRDEPRSLSALLHGIFAFTVAVEFWMVQRDLVPVAEAPAADLTFALRRRQISETVAALGDAEALTELGRALVDAVGVRLAGCAVAELPPRLGELVAIMTNDHRMIWRLRHVRLRRADVSNLATEWLSGGRTPPILSLRRAIVPSPGSVELAPRGALLRMQALDLTKSVVPRGYSLGDAALISGDQAGAKAAYLAGIRAAPHDIHAWAGLGLALRSLGEHRAASVLTSAPEVPYAVYRELSGRGAAPEPTDLAAWLASVGSK